MIEQKQMPKSIISEKLREDADTNIRRSIRALQTAVTNLTKSRDYKMPTSIELVTSADLQQQIAVHIEAIEQDMGLSDEEKKARKRSWQGTRAAASKFIGQINAVLQEWPQIKWQYYAPANNFVPSNSIDEITAEMATCNVPDEAGEFFKDVDCN